MTARRCALALFLLAAPLGPSPRAQAPVTGGVTLNFQNTDIDVVLKFFGDLTGKIFVKSDAVRGFVSVLAPRPVSTDQAYAILKSVLEIKGFALIEGRDSIVKVVTMAEAAQAGTAVGLGAGRGALPATDGMITQVIPLKFLAAQDMKTELAPLLSPGGKLISDERSNSVVVTDHAASLGRLMQVVDYLDVRSPQVLIEALIVEVSLTRETKLGLEWSSKFDFDRNGHAFTGEAAQTFSLNDFVTEGLKYSVLRTDQQLSAVLRMLATDKNVDILSTPHILTLNNQPAMIRVGEEVPVLTQTRNIQGGETIRSFDFKNVAIELEVTPRINHEREVTLKVHPLVKKILGFNAELNAPILATREAKTHVLVQDGQTVVIGGLMKDDRSESRSKIPFLGDIPILGALFRKQGVTSEKTELLVFITPRVILSPEEARAVTIEKESEVETRNTPYRENAYELYEEGLRRHREKDFEGAIDAWERAGALAPDERLRKKIRKKLKKAKTP